MSRGPCAIAVCLALAACGGTDEAPTGQVVATVGGEEITTAQLNLELAGQTGGNPAEQQALRQAALQGIVDRTILAQAARDQDLDDTPSYAMLQQRADQLVLIDLLARGGGGGAATTIGDQEVAAFIDANPERFADRRLYVVNQINVSSDDPALVKALEPVTTLDQARQLLTARGAAFGETVGVVDTLGIAPEAARQLAALQPGAVFITPGANVIHVNGLREVQRQPIGGDTATRAARSILQGERSQGLATGRIETLLKAGRPKVLYNDEFRPTPAKPAGAVPATR